MRYNSFDYWNSRPTPNQYNDIKEEEVNTIPEFIQDAKTVLDFGCGIGRTFKFYKGCEVTGFDFSSKYRASAIEHAKELDLNYTHIVQNIHKQPFNFKSKFDKGILVKVLLHANEEEANTIIKEMGRVCKEVMIIAFYSEEQQLTASHCFNHSYKELIERNGFKVLSSEIINSQIIITYAV